MTGRRARIIVTLGPQIMDGSVLRRFKTKGVDFVRTNMSHSSLEDLQHAIALAKRVGIPFIIDTEGSQVRTGSLRDPLYFPENSIVEVWSRPTDADPLAIWIRPSHVVDQLEEGDLLHIDFDTLILRVCDTSTANDGFIRARTVTSGTVGRNKAVVIDPVIERKLDLPALSEKDLESIEIGLREGIEHIAFSFVRSGEDIDELRRLTGDRMRVVAKIECREALENLDDILARADYVLIDRGDLSKEVPIERIPFIQKIILSKAQKLDVGVFVATNLLESMVEHRRPTRAEANDVVDTILDGAVGLTLAAETAVGKHPIECVNMLDRLIRHAEQIARTGAGRQAAVEHLVSSRYLEAAGESSGLISPHGGTLVTRVAAPPEDDWLQWVPKVTVRRDHRLDAEQIAIGAYSPLEGFMGEQDFSSVLNEMRLSDGTAWPVPIVLDVSSKTAEELSVGEDVALVSGEGECFAVLHLEEKFPFRRESAMLHLHGTTDRAHPGVRSIEKMGSVLLGGKIDLLRRRKSTTREFELSPRQVRHLFDEKGWLTVLGFDTPNGALKRHEALSLESIAGQACDGLFVHPVIGGAETDEASAELLVKSWEATARRYLRGEDIVFAVLPMVRRYAGHRDVLLTALCRKNFGCSHFIVGKDWSLLASEDEGSDALDVLFGEFDDLGITLVTLDDNTLTRRASAYFFSDEERVVGGDRVPRATRAATTHSTKAGVPA